MTSQPMSAFSRFLLSLVALCTFACSNEKVSQPADARQPDSTAIADSNTAADNNQPPVVERPVIHYHRIPVEGRHGLDSLTDVWGKEQLVTILKLNRKDARHIDRHDTLIVPDTLTDWMHYSPFPDRLTALDSIPKLILVNQFIQAVAAYEHGTLVHWAPTSTGKKSTPTDNGLLHTNWKSRKRHSTIDNDWVMEWYWNLANFSGVSMHEFDLPGYPASHACVRLYVDDAKWFYDWAESWRLDSGVVVAQGTPLILYGNYPFGDTAPWKFLPDAPDTTRVTTGEADSVLALYLPVIREEVRVRDSVLAVWERRRDSTTALP